MKDKLLLVIGIMLFALSQIGVNFLIYKYKNNNMEIPKVQLRDAEENKKVKKSSFAIMLEQDDGNYAQTSSNSFDQPGYVFNTEKSGCIDINGNKVDGVLNYNETTKTIGVVTSKTVYCYAYFDKQSGTDKLINTGELWSSGLSGDGHRYTGTNPNNYICFGVSDKTTCTGNTNEYMYRIIGVFESGGTKYMKLIKKETLTNGTSGYAWNTDRMIDINWNTSSLYNALNGNIYLNNATYMPSDWSDRIASWTWNSVNTQTNSNSGPNYYSILAKNVYLHEMNKPGAISGGVHGTTANTKIGLMYVSDYLLALGTASSLDWNSNTNKANFKTSWLHISNNDTGVPSTHEWTISRYGKSGSYYFAWAVNSDGYISYAHVNNALSVRPVFYLNSDEVIKSGSGTLSDPYILSD